MEGMLTDGAPTSSEIVAYEAPNAYLYLEMSPTDFTKVDASTEVTSLERWKVLDLFHFVTNVKLVFKPEASWQLRLMKAWVSAETSAEA